MNIRFHFHDTNGNACCKVQDMSTSAYVHLYCTSGYDLPAYETTFTNHTGGSDTNVFQISTPMAQLDGTNYSIELYEDSSVVTPNVSYSNGIANVSFDTVNSDVSFTLRINNIGNSDYMLDEPYINPDAQFITPTYTGFNLMAQSLGTDYDNIQNNTQNQQTYSTDGTIVYVQTITNIVLTVQTNEGTPYKVNIDGNIYYLDSNNQVTLQNSGSDVSLYAVYDANDAKYLNVDGSSFDACWYYYIPISSNTTITVGDLTSAGHTHYSPNYDMPVSGTWTDGNNTLQTRTGDSGIKYNGNHYNCNYDTSTDSMYYIERDGCDYQDGTISDTFVYDSTNDEWTYEGNTFTRVQPTTYTISVNVTGQGTVSGAGTYEEGTSTTLTPTPASGWRFDHWHDNDNNQDYYDNPWLLTVRRDWDITAIFIEGAPSQPDLTGRYYFDSTNNNVIYFTNNQSLVYGPCGEGTSYWFDWGYTDHWILQVIIGGNYENFDYDENNDVFEYNGAEFTYSSTDPCGGPGPQPTEKHIYLCDNSGAHLAEMTKTGSTWSVTGSFTSGMYSVRATVEGEYNDAWFKFYQAQGDNRIFVGAGDDPSFEDIGTYIMIDDILVSFSLVEDQETGYYVVTYQNTAAMTTSMVDTIVNSYVGEMGFVTGSDIAAMSYITMTDVESCGYIDQTSLSNMSYITMTDVQGLGYVSGSELSSMSYVSQTALSAMGYVTAGEIPTPDLTNCVKYADLNVYAYVSQPALSAMSYVDNSYLSTYMNNVVGNIESILQTI